MRYFTSDLHLSHPFVAALRGYGDPDEDNQILRSKGAYHEFDSMLIDTFNEVMRPDDELYVLGDISTGSAWSLDSALESLSHLNVPTENRHLILGNHENYGEHGRKIKFDKLKTQFADISGRGEVQIAGRKVQLSHFQFSYHFGQPPIEGLAKNMNDLEYKSVAVEKTPGTLLLHGHTHSERIFEFGDHSEMNIGLDAWNMCPLPESTITVMLEHGYFRPEDR
jgi:calcineurin-like phosphoesterase family protein